MKELEYWDDMWKIWAPCTCPEGHSKQVLKRIPRDHRVVHWESVDLFPEVFINE